VFHGDTSRETTLYEGIFSWYLNDGMLIKFNLQVCTEGRLILEFTFDDLMRIKSWHLAVRTHRELIPRSVVAMHAQQDPGMLDQLSKNITRQGITNATLNYLRVSAVLKFIWQH
jgi:hypothetical protein